MFVCVVQLDVHVRTHAGAMRYSTVLEIVHTLAGETKSCVEKEMCRWSKHFIAERTSNRKEARIARYDF